MSYVIQIIEQRGGIIKPDLYVDQTEGPVYLKSYDPEAAFGCGIAEWTHDIEEALKFPDAGAAMACYRQVPQAKPIREDGKPNRPLTAFTVSVEPVEDERVQA